MEIDRWLPYYNEICTDLGIDREGDLHSARVLSKMLRENGSIGTRAAVLSYTEERIAGRTVYVMGAGPDLEEELDRAMLEFDDIWKGPNREDVIISADGATSVLLSREIVPDIIVTDLDGSVRDQVLCLERGSAMFLHAHSDNLEAIKEHVPSLKGPVIGTTQADPALAGNLDNFGGFSDGDRAAFIAQHFGAAQIILMGFDFNEIGEKISQGGQRRPLSPEEEKWKFRKMSWAFALLGLITRPQVRSFSQNYPLSMG